MNYKKQDYMSLSMWFKKNYNGRVKKIALSGGFTCPNRDGTLDNRGCIFCSEGGSGDFALSVNPDDFSSLREEIMRLDKEARENNTENAGYVAYFQAFTNTYGKTEYLRSLYELALSEERVLGISIGTRPDCLGDEVIELISELKKRFSDKFIWIELGLQTIHEESVRYIRRHYGQEAFDAAVRKLKEIEVPIVVHVILGLPGETRQMMLQTVDYVNRFKPFGVKLQLLHVLYGTDMAEDYRKGMFDTMTMEEYVETVCDAVEHLDYDIVIHRLTGDGDKEILISPEWSGHKMTVLNAINHELALRKKVK